MVRTLSMNVSKYSFNVQEQHKREKEQSANLYKSRNYVVTCKCGGPRLKEAIDDRPTAVAQGAIVGCLFEMPPSETVVQDDSRLSRAPPIGQDDSEWLKLTENSLQPQRP